MYIQFHFQQMSSHPFGSTRVLTALSAISVARIVTDKQISATAT
jgi:hypothetical protein